MGRTFFRRTRSRWIVGRREHLVITRARIRFRTSRSRRYTDAMSRTTRSSRRRRTQQVSKLSKAIERLESRTLLANFTPAPSNDGIGTNSLRDAIIAANLTPESDDIALQSGTYDLSIVNTAGPENAAAQGDLDLTQGGFSVTIHGAGKNATLIDAHDIDRIFHIFPNVTV